MPIHDVSMPESVTIYTDGAVSGNGTAGSYGGWAVVVVVGTQERELSGAERGATNQQMELRAAIEGLRVLDRPCRVALRFVKVPGHDGVELNERCDRLAVAARERLAAELAQIGRPVSRSAPPARR